MLVVGAAMGQRMAQQHLVINIAKALRDFVMQGL
jgi:hypothetical protein